MVRAESKLRQDNAAEGDSDGPSGSALWDAPLLVGYLVSLAMTAVATVVAIGVDHEVKIPNLSLIFVLPVIVAGLGFGFGPSVCAAVLGALAFNFFLTEPRYSLAVDDPANIWAIGLLFVVGLVVSGIAYTSSRRAAYATLLRRQASVLQGYSREILTTDNASAIASVTAKALAMLFKAPAVVLFISQGQVVLTSKVGAVELREPELEAARSSLTAGAGARAGVYPDLASRFDFWPVKTTTGENAVLGLAFDSDDRPAAPDRVVDVVASILLLALERRSGRDAGPAH